MIDLNQRIRIIYPDDRSIKISKLISWARDAVSNSDTVRTEQPTTFAEVVEILEDSGYVTFHKSIDELLNSPAAYDLLDPAPAFDGVGTAAEDERIDKLLSSPDPDITGGER